MGANIVAAVWFSTPLLIIGVVAALVGLTRSILKDIFCWFTLLLNGLPLVIFFWPSIPFSMNFGILLEDKRSTRLQLADSTISDWGLRHMKHFTSLKSLSLENTGIGDRGLVHLRDRTNLVEIALGNTRITDEGLSAFSAFAELESLDLSGTRISNTGLVHLAKIKAIQRLVLSGSRVDGSGLRALTNVSIETLIIGDLPIGDSELAYLNDFKALKCLFLYRTRISSKAGVYLSRMTNLLTLEIPQTNIDDEIVPHLLKLENLRSLNLTGTGITDEGASRLQARLPECRIGWK